MPRKTTASAAVTPAPIDPFVARAQPRDATVPVLEVPDDLKSMVDEFAALTAQSRELTVKLEALKSRLHAHCRQEFVGRLLAGETGGFRILGTTGRATFVVRGPGATLSQSERTALESRFGANIGTALLRRDLSSFRFNAAVLEANYDAVVAALNTLPREIVSSLVVPGGYRAVDDAASRVREHVQDSTAALELLTGLRLTTFVMA